MQLLNIYITSGKSSGCQLKLLGSQSTPVRAIKRGFFFPQVAMQHFYFIFYTSPVLEIYRSSKQIHYA